MSYEDIDSDISTEASHAFFQERDPALAKIVVGMESVETWTHDRVASVQQTFQALSNKLEQVDMEDVNSSLHNRLIILLGYISTGKAVKLLMWIDENSPNFVAKTLAEAQLLSALDKINEGAARLFVERFEVLERMHMLSRIFSEDRLQIVQRVLRILAGEEVGEEEEDVEAQEEEHVAG